MSAAMTGVASVAGFREVELSISGMTCASCAARVQKRLGALDEVTAAVNIATGRAAVTAPVTMPVARLIEAVEQAGYGAEECRPLAGAGGLQDAGSTADAARVADLRRRLIVALVFFVPLTDLSLLELALYQWNLIIHT